MDGPSLSHFRDRCVDVPVTPRVPGLRGSCAAMRIFSCIAGYLVRHVAQDKFQRRSGRYGGL